MTFAVERNRPIPPKGAYGKIVYPWFDLGIGDSFFVPYNDEPKTKIISRISAAAHKHRDRLRITTRQEADGVRVWRVA